MQLIDNLKKYHHSREQDYTFSIVIPSWNNLDYLKNCIESINQHSVRKHQIVVFVNEGTDGTLQWLNKSSLDNLDYIYSPENLGICYGMNISRSMIKSEYIVYMNDDMYTLPEWDEEICKIIDRVNTKLFMMSATLIEPADTGNNCVVVKNFGTDLATFRKTELLTEYLSLNRSNWKGSTWPPTVLHKDTWDLVGGYSTEFSPGMYSDPDLSFKLLRAGVREFIGIGSSLVYHFGSKSTGRVNKNEGRKTFLIKWGISSRIFRKEMLRIGENYDGPLPDPDFKIRNRFVNRIKRFLNY